MDNRKDKKFYLHGVTDYEHLGPKPDRGMNVWANGVRDEYHSMEDLYDHRRALNAALVKMINYDRVDGIRALKARKHSDGTMFDGYFVVVILNKDLDGKEIQMSYHYALEHWDLFVCPEYDICPVLYDGHSPEDVIQRLQQI